MINDQRFLIGVALVIMLLMGLFPPWHATRGSIDVTAGYAFLLSRPDGPLALISIDYAKLALQVALVAVLFGLFSLYPQWMSTVARKLSSEKREASTRHRRVDGLTERSFRTLESLGVTLNCSPAQAVGIIADDYVHSLTARTKSEFSTAT